MAYPPEETEAQREENMQLFRDNLDLILANSELILKTPEFFYIRREWSLVGGAYVGVGRAGGFDELWITT